MGPLSRRTRRLRWPLALAAMGVLAGCTSRTLPLPPPGDVGVTAPDASGLVLVTGRAFEGATIGVIVDTVDGDRYGVIGSVTEVGCDDKCPFEVEVGAQPGDDLIVWQFFQTEFTPHRDNVPES